jgi:hypothetical protein
LPLSLRFFGPIVPKARRMPASSNEILDEMSQKLSGPQGQELLAKTTMVVLYQRYCSGIHAVVALDPIDNKQTGRYVC